MKNYIKIILSLTLLLSSSFAALAGKNDNWVLHPTFDTNINKIIPTAKMVYFLPLAQFYMPSAPENSLPQAFLYRYNLSTGEFDTLTSFNILSETIVKDIHFNAHRGYVMAEYNSGNIDLLFDDGSVTNVPGLMNANIPGSKNINSVTFDQRKKLAYLATDFGVVTINDAKGEISDSHNYGRKLLAFGRLGDNYLAIDENKQLLTAPTTSPLFSFDDFSPVEGGENITGLYPLTDEIMVVTRPVIIEDEENPENEIEMTDYIALTFDDDGNPSFSPIDRLNSSSIVENVRGYTIRTKSHLVLLGVNAQTTYYGLSSSDWDTVAESYDQKDYWFGRLRQGYFRKRLENGNMVQILDTFAPNASATFKCASIKYHPQYGLLTSNHGNDFFFQAEQCRMPVLLSGLKNGNWIKYGPAYTNGALTNIMYNPTGLAIDPDYSNYVYFGSLHSGLLRLNLDDPKDILHMTGPKDYSVALPGTAIICEAQEAWERMNRFSAPEFDAAGNLWTIHVNLNSAPNRQNEIWVWPRANSAATKNSSDVKPWTKLIPNTSTASNVSIILPLKHQANKNLVLVSLNNYEGEMFILDHNGTLDTASDDKYTVLPLRPVDQDGQTVNRLYIRCLYEDPATGLVWVGTDSGVFTFNPRTAQQQPNLVNRIKVARNDGTSLADYLLNGVDIFNITADSQGRKWFSTYGAGLVCTSADGRTVIDEYTTDNSGIPSNEVYAACWNPDNNTVMVSTSLGLAEVAPYGEGSGEDLSSARAFPNPVRPDYYGWVTIDGLMDNTLVKIVDADGNVIRELGNAHGGKVEWDICDASLKRAKSGVYYVLASVGPDSGNMAKVAKLLVIN